MEKIKIAPLIIALQKKLVLSPYDAAHDLTHHYRVFAATQKIVEAERLTVDNAVLTAAAWAHDLFGRSGEETKAIEIFFKKQNCRDEFIKRVIAVISQHSFGEKPTIIEAKVLFDADKLEYVNPFRLGWFIQAAKDGLLEEETYLKYRQEWKERVYQIPDLLHFSYSKKEFARMLPAAETIMEHGSWSINHGSWSIEHV